jgi:hypothetical protein
VYLLGHIAVGYLLAWAVANGRKETLILWAVFTASILPDFDVLFSRFGLVHGSYTHTLVLLIPASAILVIWRMEALPYVVALLSHVFVDMLIGPLRALFPLSSVTYSLNLKMSSNVDAIIEIGGLALMLGLMWQSGDLVRLLGRSRENLLMIVPLIFVAGSTLWAARRIGVWKGGTIISYGSSAAALEAITLGHVVLVVLIVLSVFFSFIVNYAGS